MRAILFINPQKMYCVSILLFLLGLAAASLAYPVLPGETKNPNAEQGLAKGTSLSEGDGPLEQVSRLLDRYARQIAPTPDNKKRWSPLHRAVLRGALQVTKQLLGYEGWTPNHLELLKGEQEILFEHVADEQEAPETRIGNADKTKETADDEVEKAGEGEEGSGGAANNGGTPDNEEPSK